MRAREDPPPQRARERPRGRAAARHGRLPLGRELPERDDPRPRGAAHGALPAAIVVRKASALGLGLPADVVNVLAGEFCANVRVLEGALTRLDAYATLAGRPVTLALLRETLGAPPGAGNGGPTLARIIGLVCEHYSLSRTEIASPRRTARL